MTRPPLVLLLAVALAGLPAPVAGQTPLSLADAITTATAANPSLRAAQAGGDAARELSRAARSEWFPRIEFAENWHRSTQPVAAFGTLLNAGRFTAADFAVDRLNAPGRLDGFARYAGVRQVLYDGGRTRALAAAARATSAAADARVDAATADLAYRVTEAYGRLIAAEAGVDAARAGLDWAIEAQQHADARRTAGTATDADVLAASVRIADMRQRQIQAAGDVVTARATLNSLMGAPLDQTFVVSLPMTAIAPSALPDLAVLRENARAGRAELRNAEQAVAAAEAGQRLNRSALWPDLSAAAGYEWNGTEFTARQSSWTIGAELRWSLSLGGSDIARVAAGRATATAARAERDAAIAAIDLEVVVAQERWRVAVASAEVSRLVADEAREAQRIMRQRYAAGMASMTDVLAAQSAWFAADAQATANRVGLLTAWAALERATGHPLPSVSR